MASKSAGKTGDRSRLLEHCVEQFRVIGFHIYKNAQFKKLQWIPSKYIVTGYEHLALYGGRGFKEGLIVFPPEYCTLFATDDDGSARIIIEAKSQGINGSTDEKFPYVWEQFLESPIKNWIVVYDGSFWSKQSRGIQAVQWLKNRAVERCPEGRTFRVLSRRQFSLFVAEVWGVKDE